MARRAKEPWQREEDGCYYTTIQGRQVNLGSDKRTAWQEFRRLHASPAAGGDMVEAAAVCDAYLAHRKAAKSHGVYRKERIFLSSFCREYGGKAIRDLKKNHLTNWLSRQETWCPATRDEAGGCVKACFGWAADEEYVLRNPFATFRREHGKGTRSRLLTSGEWDELLKKSRGEFGDFLRVLRLTGARPGEVRKLTAEGLDEENSCCQLDAKEHKTGKKTQEPRIIWLPPAALEILRWQKKKHGGGPLFRDRFGKMLSAFAIRKRFFLLRRVCGIDDGVVMYLARHQYATEALKTQDVATVATLLGHKGTGQLMNTYSHLVKQAPYMKEAARKAAEAQGK